MPMPLPPSPSPMGMGGASAQGQAPVYGGEAAMQSQPSGGEQMSDPKVIIASVLAKVQDLMQALNQQFPGGEDKINEGMQSIGMGFSEKIQRMGGVEPPGPNIPA